MISTLAIKSWFSSTEIFTQLSKRSSETLVLLVASIHILNQTLTLLASARLEHSIFNTREVYRRAQELAGPNATPVPIFFSADKTYVLKSTTVHPIIGIVYHGHDVICM